jgi:hypothetical protein
VYAVQFEDLACLQPPSVLSNQNATISVPVRRYGGKYCDVKVAVTAAAGDGVTVADPTSVTVEFPYGASVVYAQFTLLPSPAVQTAPVPITFSLTPVQQVSNEWFGTDGVTCPTMWGALKKMLGFPVLFLGCASRGLLSNSSCGVYPSPTPLLHGRLVMGIAQLSPAWATACLRSSSWACMVARSRSRRLQ